MNHFPKYIFFRQSRLSIIFCLCLRITKNVPNLSTMSWTFVWKCPESFDNKNEKYLEYYLCPCLKRPVNKNVPKMPLSRKLCLIICQYLKEIVWNFYLNEESWIWMNETECSIWEWKSLCLQHKICLKWLMPKITIAKKCPILPIKMNSSLTWIWNTLDTLYLNDLNW